jgi:PAS domain S-box-containing protein
MLPLVAGAAVVAVVGGFRLSGPMRWVALAAPAVLGDIVLTLFSFHRYSLGWYVGRSLTVVSSGVVLVALLAQFSRLKAQLAREAEQLRCVLARTEELEALHSTLLSHMSDGVILQDGTGRVIAANTAAASILGLSADQLHQRARADPGWGLLHEDGTEWPLKDTPPMATLLTGVAQHDRMVGVRDAGKPLRWLRVNTAATRAGGDGEVRFVVTSMTDETRRHDAFLAATRETTDKRRCVQGVLDAGGPMVVVQPIVDLTTGTVVGGEALSRFAGPPMQGPDRWFADATQVGLGCELELAAVRSAQRMIPSMPAGAYLSINVSPVTAMTPELFDLLARVKAAPGLIVLELTEHMDVTDYPKLGTALAALRRLGARIAVDDTGSGFASLRHILNLSPEFVKLDVDLVRNIDTDPARRALAAGLLIFTQEVGAVLVAEGIETQDELNTLREVGITHGQGYHLGRPAPLPLPTAVPIGDLMALSWGGRDRSG